MLAITILLRRLFTHRPTAPELDFHWWFVANGGINDWHRYLAAKGFVFSKRNRVIRNQEKISLKMLEVWDTETFYRWKTTRKHPIIQGNPVVPEWATGHLSTAFDPDHAEDFVIPQIMEPRTPMDRFRTHDHDYRLPGDHQELPPSSRKTLPHSHF